MTGGGNCSRAQGTNLQTIASRLQEQIAEAWGPIARALGARRDIGALSSITLEDFKWGIAIVWSRGVSLQIGTLMRKTIVPFFGVPAERVCTTRGNTCVSQIS